MKNLFLFLKDVSIPIILIAMLFAACSKDIEKPEQENINPVLKSNKSLFWVPDDNFRAYLKQIVPNAFTSSNSLITNHEDILAIQKIRVSSCNISSLAGIEFFTALEELCCDKNQLTSLDMSKNIALEELNCHSNRLTSLDVSKNTALEDLSCYENNLTSLDVSKNTFLERLRVDQAIKCETSIVIIDPTYSYYWDGSKFTRYYPAKDCPTPNLFWVPDDNFRAELKKIVPNAFTPTSSLITDHPDVLAVTYISVFHKGIISLDGIQFFTALTELVCNQNNLTSLDVSKNTALEYLHFDDNKLTSLNVSKNTALEYLSFTDNQLTSLDVSKNTALESLVCYRNNLTSLDVSKNTALTKLHCFKNKLTSLNVSKNTALKYLSCYNNNLTSLDVSKNTALEHLDCSGSNLTSLDVSKNTALKSLSCYENKLTSLDVSKNTAFTWLSCYNNNLTSLDVSKNTALKNLYVDEAIKCDPSIVRVNPVTCKYWDGQYLNAYYPANDCP